MRTNCPNCGAPIIHYYNYNCEYCGTFLHNTNEEIQKFNNVDIKVDDIKLEKSPVKYSLIVSIYAHTIPKVQWLCESGNNNIFTHGDSIGKKVGIRYKIPFDIIYKELSHRSIEFLWTYVINHLPQEFKKDEDLIVERLIEKIRMIVR